MSERRNGCRRTATSTNKLAISIRLASLGAGGTFKELNSSATFSTKGARADHRFSITPSNPSGQRAASFKEKMAEMKKGQVEEGLELIEGSESESEGAGEGEGEVGGVGVGVGVEVEVGVGVGGKGKVHPL